jgi:predicted small secreted protein
MKKLLTLVLIVTSVLLAACGGSGGAGTGASSKPALEVKLAGKDVPLDVKSSWQMTKDYTSYSDPKTPTTALHWFTIRNYEYDKPNGTIMFDNEKLKAPGQVLVFFSLYGEKGTTDEKTPVKVGTYKDDGHSSTSLSTVTIFVFGEGKDEVASLTMGAGVPGNKGEVKITSVTSDTVTGEIDAIGKANDKDVSVKGTFTAKIYKLGQ